MYTITLKDNYIAPDAQARQSYIDVHEHRVTPWNTILAPVANITQKDLTSIGGKPDQYMVDCLFYEIDVATNDILFSWSALDRVPIALSTAGIEGYGTHQKPFDPYRLNTITPAKQGYVISLQHCSSTFYHNKDCSIRWQLSSIDGGDFQLNYVGFSRQSHVRIYNETDDSFFLSLFGSVKRRGKTDMSSALILNVDLVNYQATPLRKVSDPNDPVYSPNPGSLQVLGPKTSQPHLFVGYEDVPKLKEYDGEGNAVLTAQFGEFELQSYHGYKFQWRATPSWKPAVVVHRASDKTVEVYMSWNGATEYALGDLLCFTVEQDHSPCLL
ncbi:hypothetical protein EYZ11_002090 [Aspergillus tanneri]|uniref:ASST-domain-containing protein n=1 Tax=Aspergillus tanneri TaxID=1220188 RepID=A0A4S3JU65_9EURO|nr:uncharacterized protein ATNIH1004_003210 [Aspergillus tanneri]KAA8650523.1 hypothetical protein ATNIH1004_003210 [Aspergillus tanneri]THC98431.1 hypothetical protein EYZ11_002090 [Aspergillus tanneri]